MRGEGQTTLVDWGVAGSPLRGEAVSGDLHVVAEVDRNTLLGVVDGLGHGSEALHAATRACEFIEGNAGLELQPLLARANEALRGTRGVTASLARLDGRAGRMTWVGVGNVTGLFVPSAASRAKEALGGRGGVVGYKLPALAPRSLPVERGDTLVLATDGLRGGFSSEPLARLSPADAAERLLEGFGKPDDDALVLVARYRGAPA